MKIITLLFVFISAVWALSCSQRWQCLSVSENFNYVDCINATCQCLFDQGFDNAATLDDKCRCDPEDGKVYYENGLAYCVDIKKAAKQKTRYNRLLSRTKLVFEQYTNRTIANDIIEGRINVDHIVHPNSRIRVDILGSFGGIHEYLFALWAQNDIVRSVVRNYVVDAVQGIVWARTDFLFNFFTVQMNASYVGPIKFSDDDRMLIMDFSTLWFSNIDLVIQNPTAREQVILGTCHVYATECIPFGYTGYSSFENCIQYHQSLNFGLAALTEDNSTFCHFFHRSLTPYNKIHCTHMEPNGGNPDPLLAACSRKPVGFYYQQTQYDVN